MDACTGLYDEYFDTYQERRGYVIEKKLFCLYINSDIDLKVKVYDVDDKAEVHMNYKGYNLAIPMLVWEFGSVLEFASINDVSIEGEPLNRKYFTINKNDKEKFLDEMYFFQQIIIWILFYAKHIVRTGILCKDIVNWIRISLYEEARERMPILILQ